MLLLYAAAGAAAAVMCGCSNVEKERRPITQLETVPPRTATSPTFTGSLTSYSETTRREPLYGTITVFGQISGADTADNFIDTAADAADIIAAPADTADNMTDTAVISYDYEAAEADTADIYYDTAAPGADPADSFRDTADTSEIQY